LRKFSVSLGGRTQMTQINTDFFIISENPSHPCYPYSPASLRPLRSPFGIIILLTLLRKPPNGYFQSPENLSLSLHPQRTSTHRVLCSPPLFPLVVKKIDFSVSIPADSPLKKPQNPLVQALFTPQSHFSFSFN